MKTCFFIGTLSISPEDADELLKTVIKLWVTIRGYSLTAAWFEEYKKAHHSSSKKKALRKDLRLNKQTSIAFSPSMYMY